MCVGFALFKSLDLNQVNPECVYNSYCTGKFSYAVNICQFCTLTASRACQIKATGLTVTLATLLIECFSLKCDPAY